MKNAILNTMAILMSLVMVLSSCSKNTEMISPTEQTDVLTTEFMTDIENMSQEYITEQDQRIWWIVGKLALCDALGGGLAYYNDSDAGWQEIAVNAAGVSLISGVGLLSVAPGDTMPWYAPKYVEKTTYNPNNQLAAIGVMHNQFVISITNECTDNNISIYKGMSSVSSVKLASEKDFNQLNFEILQCKNKKGFQSYIKASSLPKASKQILRKYVNVMFKSKSILAFHNFSIKIENMIANNKGLTKNTKDGLLLTMAIARYSSGMWNDIM